MSKDKNQRKPEYNLELVGSLYVCFLKSDRTWDDFIKIVKNYHVAKRLLEDKAVDSGLPFPVVWQQVKRLFDIFKQGEAKMTQQGPQMRKR